MNRRQLLRQSAVTGLVGLTGVAVYRQVADRFWDETPSNGEIDTDPNGDRPTETPTDLAPPTEEQPVRHGDEFGTVVDAVKAGADPEGNEPIGDMLEEYADDDTLLSFPAGTYLLPQIRLTGYDHLGVAAAHDEHPTFVAPANSCIDTDPHIQFDQITNFLLEGIDFDFRREGAGGAVNVIASGDATVRDVTAQGSCRQQIAMFRIDIRDPEGTGLVERLRMQNAENSGWMTGAYVGQRHSGEVTFRDCELSEFTDNGLYGSAPGVSDGGGGTVHTEGGHFENNNVSNIRLGTAGSTARDDTIVVESAPKIDSINLRGIRFRRGSGQLVEDCDIRFGPDVTNSFGAIVFHADNGGARVANTQVTMDSDDIPAIKAFYHSGGGEGGPTFENLTVDGEAKRGYTVQLNGRDGTVFRNCTIEQQGDHRDGIRVAYSEGCELVDSRIDVSGYPLILRDSTMTIRNTTFVTPDGERHVDHMEAGPGDFRPGSWT
ncbi:MAG: right-handed parallel beta-helix repeat-containing protein [Halobacteriota archaeon]